MAEDKNTDQSKDSNPELEKAFRDTIAKYGTSAKKMQTEFNIKLKALSIGKIMAVVEKLNFSEEDKLFVLRKHTKFNDDMGQLQAMDFPELSRQLRYNSGISPKEVADKVSSTVNRVVDFESFKTGTNDLARKIADHYTGINEPDGKTTLPNLKPEHAELLKEKLELFVTHKDLGLLNRSPDKSIGKVLKDVLSSKDASPSKTGDEFKSPEEQEAFLKNILEQRRTKLQLQSKSKGKGDNKSGGIEK